MKFYLSSYRLGNSPELMLNPKAQNNRVCVIQNAHDGWNDMGKRREVLNREFDSMKAIGLSPEEIDLRLYFGKSSQLKEELNKFSYLWVCGGNTFILRMAFSMSGLDKILWSNIYEDSIVYGGYSAGVCVLAPTLKGIHLADDPENHPEHYRKEVIWEGLGILPYCVAPHYKSDHYETELIDRSVNYFIENKIPFVALHDGEAIIFEATQTAEKLHGVNVVG